MMQKSVQCYEGFWINSCDLYCISTECRSNLQKYVRTFEWQTICENNECHSIGYFFRSLTQETCKNFSFWAKFWTRNETSRLIILSLCNYDWSAPSHRFWNVPESWIFASVKCYRTGKINDCKTFGYKPSYRVRHMF